MDLEFDTNGSPADIADCLYRHGVVLVRDHYPVALIAAIAAVAVRCYAEEDVAMREGRLAIDPQRCIALQDIRINDAPVFPALVTEVWRMASGVCLDTLTPSVTNAYVRRTDSETPDFTLPFHQDTRILARPLINVWVPLQDCGRTIPGLEVVAGRIDVMPTLPPGSGTNFYAGEGYEIEAASVFERYADNLWHPAFRAGDLLMFLGTTIHRTHVTQDMRGQRMNIEMRLIAPPSQPG